MNTAAADAPEATRTTVADKPVIVGVPTSETGRFTLFTVSLAGTMQPAGSRIHVTASASVTENCNTIIREMLKDDYAATVWLQGDDHVWRNDALVTMLRLMDEHPEIDALVPLVVKRNPPWTLVIFDVLDGQFDDQYGAQLFRVKDFAEIPDADVFEVDAAGSAGMLIRREVLEAMDDPWFYSTPDPSGKTQVLNEDVTFCLSMRAHGFRLFATPLVTMGHIGLFNVRPTKHPETGEWVALTEFSSADEQYKRLFMPLGEDDAAVTLGKAIR